MNIQCPRFSGSNPCSITCVQVDDGTIIVVPPGLYTEFQGMSISEVRVILRSYNRDVVRFKVAYPSLCFQYVFVSERHDIFYCYQA